MNNQTSGITERILYGIAMFLSMRLVSKGVITPEMASYLAGGVVAFVGSMWAWWINRPKAIAQAAASIPGTTVVTTDEIAKSTPNQSNIISNMETQSSIAQTVKDNKEVKK
jgi:hypothetical protein